MRRKTHTIYDIIPDADGGRPGSVHSCLTKRRWRLDLTGFHGLAAVAARLGSVAAQPRRVTFKRAGTDDPCFMNILWKLDFVALGRRWNNVGGGGLTENRSERGGNSTMAERRNTMTRGVGGVQDDNDAGDVEQLPTMRRETTESGGYPLPPHSPNSSRPQQPAARSRCVFSTPRASSSVEQQLRALLLRSSSSSISGLLRCSARRKSGTGASPAGWSFF
ncbi:DegT/DnrJ/EryC1/StrS family aminotransferase [Sesbania bispinosa]|nr:DegT/DnrJ/EryC1/StrS family aminotransferase [Sesbania bispinosa]